MEYGDIPHFNRVVLPRVVCYHCWRSLPLWPRSHAHIVTCVLLDNIGVPHVAVTFSTFNTFFNVSRTIRVYHNPIIRRIGGILSHHGDADSGDAWACADVWQDCTRDEYRDVMRRVLAWSHGYQSFGY